VRGRLTSVRGTGQHGPVAQTVLEADYVLLVERRHSVSGHWLNAYPFVRLHQSSSTYDVASMGLGRNRIQESGPEAGWDERATAAEICS
jgi:hypothetical protein